MAEQFRELAKNNIEYARQFKSSYDLQELFKRKNTLVLACTDPRSDPARFWTYGEDGPATIRTAGGRAIDAMRTLEVISTMGKGLECVVIVHHTQCGLGAVSEEQVRDRIKTTMKGSAALQQDLQSRTFGAFTDIEKSVREDVDLIRANPYLPADLEVLGYIHDVQTGKATEIEV